jgi:pyruvate dehydrogenase E2 component (dihydrolipoamide acetyltransferase)
LTDVRGTGPGGRIVALDVRAVAQQGGAGSTSPRATPLVRRDAGRLGIDVAEVAGTGLGGRVTRHDVRAAASSTATPEPQETTAAVLARIPLTGMRGAIARSMTASLRDMAQLTHAYEVDVTELAAVRTTLKSYGDGLVVPSINDFVIKACAMALRAHRRLNATIRDEEILELAAIDVGFAVSLPDGLIVPVVPGADELSLAAVSSRTRRLAGAARSGTLALAEAQGATFVVTALGAQGVDMFTPVVNPGNVAILGVGRVRDSVRWEDDQAVRTQVMTLSLSFDHRAVDGVPAAEFLRAVGELLGRPLAVLAHSGDPDTGLVR